MTHPPNSARRILLAVSGASGALYAVHTLRMLVDAGVAVDLVYSAAARRVLTEETELTFERDARALLRPDQSCDRVRVHDHADIGAPPASGTALGDSVVVVPCSLSTLAGIAHGSAANLTERAAQVALKEGRRLVLVPRETPLGRSHLDAMSRLAWAGAVILPAAPGFYHRPQTVADLVDFVSAKILRVCGVEQDRVPAWDGGTGGPSGAEAVSGPE